MSVPVSNMRIVARWADMYADWEEGKQVSPSSDDLARVACDMWGVPHATGAEGDAFEEVTQDSTHLETQVEYLASLIDGRATT